MNSGPDTTPLAAEVTRVQDGTGPGLPRVTVVLPVRNEAANVEECLQRLLQQDYPADLLEIFVVDGGSVDGTRDVVRSVQARYAHACIRLLDNPSGIVPTALNIGIRAATGAVIVRMDGHSVPASDYVSACVAALDDSGAGNVGGVIEAVGTTPFGRAVAVASTHRLGAGDARYRLGGSKGDVDTVPFGAFRKSVFERVGLFDESLVRNQDYEMNVRIREAGARVHFDPAIRVVYKARPTMRGLFSQYYQYGWWRVETLRRHPRSLRWRQVAPPAFVASVLVGLAASSWSRVAAMYFLLALIGYLTTVAVTALLVVRPGLSPVMVGVAFPIMHFAYGLGFVCNVLSMGRLPYRAQEPTVPRLDAVDVQPNTGVGM